MLYQEDIEKIKAIASEIAKEMVANLIAQEVGKLSGVIDERVSAVESKLIEKIAEAKKPVIVPKKS